MPFLTSRQRLLPHMIIGGFLATLSLSTMAAAGPIERACKTSERRAATAQLCNCIQSVAERRLTRSEQKIVSAWISDPHEAQIVRQSDRQRDTRLWEKYKSFGSAAAQSCG